MQLRSEYQTFGFWKQLNNRLVVVGNLGHSLYVRCRDPSRGLETKSRTFLGWGSVAMNNKPKVSKIKTLDI